MDRILTKDHVILEEDLNKYLEDIQNKQDIISDLETIRQGAAKGATSIQDISHLATKEQINSINQVSWSILEDTFIDYEYVDLGLPSGTLWASCNVGATSPEEYGDYFAWGETTTKSDYRSSNSVTYGLSISELESRGITDTDGNLTATYDAATANWGDNWRMPTLYEMKELGDICTWEWVTVDGVNGSKVTGPNGNSIFLPAAGYYNGTKLGDTERRGTYWSATVFVNNSNITYGHLGYFYSENHKLYVDSFYYGYPIRPVININN